MCVQAPAAGLGRTVQLSTQEACSVCSEGAVPRLLRAEVPRPFQTLLMVCIGLLGCILWNFPYIS